MFQQWFALTPNGLESKLNIQVEQFAPRNMESGADIVASSCNEFCFALFPVT